MTDDIILFCPECDFETTSESGLKVHHARQHREDEDAEGQGVQEAEAEAPEPAAPKPKPAPKKPEPTTVTFVCQKHPFLVVAPGGKRIAKFDEGELTTSDPKVIRYCREIPQIEEKTA